MPELTFNLYQENAVVTDTMLIGVTAKDLTGSVNDLWYPTCGLTNEAGEVAGKVKKIARDNQGLVTPEKKEALAHELGDVLWYLSAMATRIGYTLEEIAAMNMSKLKDRMDRGVLKGDGDNR